MYILNLYVLGHLPCIINVEFLSKNEPELSLSTPRAQESERVTEKHVLITPEEVSIWYVYSQLVLGSLPWILNIVFFQRKSYHPHKPRRVKGSQKNKNLCREHSSDSSITADTCPSITCTFYKPQRMGFSKTALSNVHAMHPGPYVYCCVLVLE